MQESWVEIKDFPGYAVSDQGRVKKMSTDRIKVPSINQAGVSHVIMMRDSFPYRRSVAYLVADAFLADMGLPDHFNALIHLDGHKENCAVYNLRWRPRWFARKYHQQFEPGGLRGFREPVKEVHSGEVFNTSWEAAIKYGLLDSEIKIATLNRTYVFPTGQIFRTLR